MFGRSRRTLRAEVLDLQDRLDVSRRETRAARGDCGIATREMHVWRRRAVETADRVVDVELQLRGCRREIAAYERKAYREVLPTLPQQRTALVLDVAS